MSSTEVFYTELTATHQEAACRLMAKAFGSREPLVLHLGITEEEMYEFLVLALGTVRSSRSTIALADDKVIGLLLAESFADDPITLTPAQEERFAPIFELLNQMAEEFFVRHPVPRDQVHHQLMVSVDEGYKRHKVCENMIQHNNAMAAKKGFRYCLAEVTGPISQNVAIERCGYTLDRKYTYAELSQGAAARFQDMKLSEFCGLVWRTLH